MSSEKHKDVETGTNPSNHPAQDVKKSSIANGGGVSASADTPSQQTPTGTTIATSDYPGSGTEEDPFLVNFNPLIAPSSPLNKVVDKEYPMQWSLIKKWGANVLAALTMMTGTFSVSAYASSIEGLERYLHRSSVVLRVGQTTFLLGLALGSITFPATADYFGRRKVILITMSLFTAFLAGVAGARNLATILVCRFFAGYFASAAQTLIPASVSALFLPKDIAVPFTTAAIAPFLGPVLGPLLGGYVEQYSGSWRNVNWLATGMAGGFTVIYLLFVPETYAPYILRQRAAKLTKKTGLIHISQLDKDGRRTFGQEIQIHLMRPLRYLIFEPIVTIFTLYISFLYGILNIFFASFPYIYVHERHWSIGNAGLPFIALLLGFGFSVPVTMLCGRPYAQALARHGKAPPEKRLYFAMLSACLLPISLFWMGWSGEPGTHWIAPVIAGGIFGFSQIGLQMSTYVYLADVYGITVGATFAAMNFVRFALSSVFPLFSYQMYDNLGVPWASSTLAFILLAFLPAPFLFYRFGPKIRSWSPYSKSNV